MYGQRGNRLGSSGPAGPSWSVFSSNPESKVSESKEDSEGEAIGALKWLYEYSDVPDVSSDSSVTDLGSSEEVTKAGRSSC